MRRAARVDDNQQEIVAEFRMMGCSVLHTHQLGHGAPDLIIGKNGNNILVEIKDGSQPLSKRALTDDEHKFHKEWRGRIEIVENIFDVAIIVKGLTNGF
jgi:hypothetical protein